MAKDEWAGDTLYALARPMGGEQSVYRSIDKGDSWEELCTASGVRSLVLGPGGVLYGVGECAVHTWTPMLASLPTVDNEVAGIDCGEEATLTLTSERAPL